MGNLEIRGGTIFALPSFAPGTGSDGGELGSFLLVVGHNCTRSWRDKGGCSWNVGVQQLTLDARKAAAGCLFVDHVQFSTVGPGIMLLGFSTYGIAAFGSGGTVIQGVFAGEYPVSDPRGHDLSLLSGTAVHFAAPQHDGYITNSIIWSAKVGVVAHGAAQQLVGLHPWNYVNDPTDGHQTSAVDGAGLGIVVPAGGCRVEDCYLDTVPLVLNMSSDRAHTLVSGNLFLKNASVVLAAPRWSRSDARTGVHGLTITNNVFSCKNDAQFGACEAAAVVLDETGSRFGDSVVDVRVDGNIVDGDAGYRASKARKMIGVRGATFATLDFGDSLLFPGAALRNGSVSCSLRDGMPVSHSVRADNATAPLVVRVDLSESWTGTIECQVDQSATSRCAL